MKSDKDEKRKNIVLLGSTGSIGQQTLDVVRAFPDKFRVVALAAGWNMETLLEQVREFHPRYVFHQNDSVDPALFSEFGCRVLPMVDMVAIPEVDLVMVATSGRAGLAPILEGIKRGKTLALANKEPIIMAGEILTEEARRHGAQLLPVDSEPSAIWQCIQGEDHKVSRIILTASGGPFRRLALEEFFKITPEQALKHPTWVMGRKITIDSATLMNKGFEVIEASWLFDVPIENIDVVVHPQSIVHSLVEFVDGSVKAQVGPPDMRLPIQYSMTYPDRVPNAELPRLDLVKVKHLDFEPLDIQRYPCFKLALEAGRRGGSYPAVLAASDEVAVGLFLINQIGFHEIPRVVEAALNAHQPISHPSIEQVLEVDAWARDYALKQLPD